jgi:hypothetical protein
MYKVHYLFINLYLKNKCSCNYICKAQVRSHCIAGIVGPNPAGGMNVCLMRLLRVQLIAASAMG